ncbi:LysM peptidoglycan-binding domain-containing protein [Nesterenkonia sp. CF4.4]|uniref:LysM peptidoglycan-binding domain-containing protein n=1 Tax=Nesterenkonia sp. CF4.4 TaxID=3373079 RepID=UPI003EE5BD46
MGIRRAAWTPTREGGVPAPGLQDLLLSAAFIASGPALWCFATLILSDRPEISTLLGQIQHQHQPGIKAAETLLGLLAAAAGILISAGAIIAVLALLAQQIAHRCDAWTLERALMRWSPGFLRRTVALTLGTGLALTAVGADSWPRPPETSASQTPASQTSGATDSVLFDAAEPEATEPDTAERDTAEPDTPEPSPETARPPSGLFTPEDPTLNTDRLQGVPQRRGSEPEQVVVRLGDSLWEIAAEHLGSDATDWEIAASWPQWYAANRDRIGDDPGIIHPGTILNAPSP